jgi:hypothetical protein
VRLELAHQFPQLGDRGRIVGKVGADLLGDALLHPSIIRLIFVHGQRGLGLRRALEALAADPGCASAGSVWRR